MRFLGWLLTRDRIYPLSLLIPFVVYNLALKAYDAASRPTRLRLTRILEAMRSDVFFNLGYSLFWIGLLSAMRRGPLCRVVIALFHAATILVALIRTGAHQYFRETGTTLDYDIVALWGPRLDEVKPMIRLPLLTRLLLAATLFYAILGPWLLTRTVGRWREWLEVSPLEMSQKTSFSGSLRLWLSALGFGSLSFLVGSGSAGISKSFARDPLVNLIVTGVKEAISRKDEHNASTVVEHPAARATLARTSRTERRNVVLIHLESTRAQSVTPYNEDLKTTPFLDELARSSLLAERAYTIVPNTLKASVSVNRGIEPRLWPSAEMAPDGIPARGLADLLKEQGYNTVFFQSSTENFENFRHHVKDFGYEEYYPLESMDTDDFERSNYFGYEDNIMLKPSEQWLEKHRDKPFVAKYLTGTGHHEYLPPTRYGLEDFSEDDKLNRYLNCLRYQDIFVKNLFDQYRELGVYENTIFVVFGDHGEGFGEHGRYAHENNPYEESLRIPLIIHDPKRFQSGEWVEGLSNLTDILPTVLDLLGYEVKNAKYPGYSLLRPLPKDRPLMFSCFNKDKCLVSIKGFEKYIHHYDNQPDELFDLSKDPFEECNLANERAKEVKQRREDLLAWRSRINAVHSSKWPYRKKRS
ncbi:MAG: sulfatase-like hydrolase/transferase [Actinobacteria bacterium]|nr:sulfatase-like hydrolase/transferase [Actinomycetota bacterium]